MAEIGFGVTLRGYPQPEWMFTFNLASGITTDDVGKAVTLDTSGANKVKLAGDGDVIIGRLETVENRLQEGTLVGTVALKFLNTLPYTGTAPTIGQSVVGSAATAGAVVAAASDLTGIFVVEVDATNNLVTVVKG